MTEDLTRAARLEQERNPAPAPTPKPVITGRECEPPEWLPPRSQLFLDPPSPAAHLEAYQTKNGYDVEIHPGFGCVTLCRDGVEFRRDEKGERNLTWYESLIRKAALPHQPTPVWTLHVDGPFRSYLYALTPSGWALLDTKDGFA